jgi:uncharacterized membrane protein YgdD (TMEM256/DUF423 family)
MSLAGRDRDFRFLPKRQGVPMPRASLILGALAALIGAGGVALAAAAAHREGGDLATTAAYFLILHAAALLALTACTAVFSTRRAFASALLAAGAALALGTLIFSADLSSRAFEGSRLFPLAAPIGGSLMILAWLALAVVFIIGAVGRRG